MKIHRRRSPMQKSKQQDWRLKRVKLTWWKIQKLFLATTFTSGWLANKMQKTLPETTEPFYIFYVPSFLHPFWSYSQIISSVFKIIQKNDNYQLKFKEFDDSINQIWLAMGSLCWIVFVFVFFALQKCSKWFADLNKYVVRWQKWTFRLTNYKKRRWRHKIEKEIQNIGLFSF